MNRRPTRSKGSGRKKIVSHGRQPNLVQTYSAQAKSGTKSGIKPAQVKSGQSKLQTKPQTKPPRSRHASPPSEARARLKPGPRSGAGRTNVAESRAIASRAEQAGVEAGSSGADKRDSKQGNSFGNKSRAARSGERCARQRPAFAPAASSEFDGTRTEGLVDSERNFRLLVKGVTDYALYMLDPQGYVSSWNAGGERIKGYAASEIIGQHFSRFYTPSDRAAAKPARALQIARERGNYQEEGWRVRKDGSFFWASVVIDPIYDDDGTLVGFAKITRDISERRNAQLALENVQRQLAESQKMDALGQLTGGIAHDFNNLLMIITGNTQVLKRLGEQNPKIRRAVEAIETAAQRGAGLTRQLLTFSRRQQLNPQVIEIGERIGAVRDILGSALDGSDLVIDIASDAWPISIDVGEFEIALVNLAVNARDAMPGGGTVTISTRNVRLDNERCPAGDYLALTFADTGIGIPQDMLERVFDPFFTTKAHGKGTGLGLSQVHGFAHQAGGSVSVTSTLGKGTTFTLYLPRATPRLAAVAGDAEPRRTGTVLLVEDNPDVADASTVLLEQLGYAVHWVSDGQAALARIEKNGYDLVVSDVVMSGHPDGVALARLIRQRRPHLPILLATGYSEAAREAGRDFTILHKPYAMHELSQSIAKVIAAAG